MRNASVLVRQTLKLALFVLCMAGWVAASTRIDNVVTISDPNSTTLHVTTTIADINQPQLEVGVPNWTPGYYTTEDFARNISRMVFTDQQGRPLTHRKNHDSLWILNTRGASTVKIEFDYTANQLDLNKSQITPTYAILNGINFFFYVKDHTLDIPESVTFKLPKGWSIATGLVPTGDAAVFTAENYDVLVDSPVLAGEFDMVTLPLRGVPHHLAVAPKGVLAQADLQKLAADSLKVIDVHTRMFGEIPYKEYLTINVFSDRDIGGLEHLNSYLGILSKRGAGSENIPGLVSLTSHEFFHAYNVKRIRPAEMWPYRYYERNYTPLLWVSEGVTDYYTDRGKLRAGLMTPDSYLAAQGQLLPFVQSVEAAKYISVEEASINTWFGGIGGGAQPFVVDYYSRGDVLGLLLDLSIRHDTSSKSSLDDVMRALYTDFYKKSRGFTTENLITAINKLTGKDYHPFFEKYVSGTEALPYDQTLAYAGLRLNETSEKVIRLGITANGDNNTVTAVTPGGAAEAAGIKPGDVLVGIGDASITNDPDWAANFRKAYANKVGEMVTLHILRESKPISLSMKVTQIDFPVWNMQRVPDMTKEQQALLDGWLAIKP
ncbi:MAG TPA: PDZ domain-containing protein [Pyrinomonadaceae bacterium]|nr:PDZ domain-containing protein [Pyrinomonadaceae bacterium]